MSTAFMSGKKIYQVHFGFPSGTTIVPPVMYAVAADEAKAAAEAIALREQLYGADPDNGEYVMSVTLIADETGTPMYASSETDIP